MLEALQKGDEVVTAGGIARAIAKLDEQYVTRRDRAEHARSVVQRSRDLSSCCPRARIKGARHVAPSRHEPLSRLEVHR